MNNKYFFAVLLIMGISFNSYSQLIDVSATELKNAQTIEDVNLYRIQVKLTTGRGMSAGTDGGVSLQVNDLDKPFFLARSIDNFEEGHSDVYDFLSANVNKVSDIHYLKFTVKDDDGWCAKKIELFFNNSTVPFFVKEYPGSGRCIDNKQSFTISSGELRADTHWKLSGSALSITNPPRQISKAMIVSMVEAAIGNQINYEPPVAWGTTGTIINNRWGDAVEVSFKNDHTLHFDLDLQLALYGPNPELDVDFDVIFSCNNGVIKTEVANVTSGTNYIGTVQEWVRTKGVGFITAAIASAAGHPEVGVVAGGLLSKFLDFKIGFKPGSQTVPGSCRVIRVLNNCSILLQ